MLDLKILRVIAPGWPGSAIARTRLIHGVSDPDLDKKMLCDDGSHDKNMRGLNGSSESWF